MFVEGLFCMDDANVFRKWLLCYNTSLSNEAIKTLHTLVCDAGNLMKRKKTLKTLRDRATVLGFSTVEQMINACDHEYRSCQGCGKRERYFKPCPKCKTAFYCSLLCQSKCAKKHRKKCRKLCAGVSHQTSPTEK